MAEVDRRDDLAAEQVDHIDDLTVRARLADAGIAIDRSECGLAVGGNGEFVNRDAPFWVVAICLPVAGLTIPTTDSPLSATSKLPLASAAVSRPRRLQIRRAMPVREPQLNVCAPKYTSLKVAVSADEEN